MGIYLYNSFPSPLVGCVAIFKIMLGKRILNLSLNLFFMKFPKSIADGGNGVLDGLSRVLNIDVRYFMKSGFWIYLGYGCSVLFRVVLLVIFARFADKDFYGQYQFISTVLWVLVVFSMPGMDTAVVQSVARGFESSLIYGARAKLRWSLLGSVALVCVSLYFKYISPRPFWNVFMALVVFFPLWVAGSSITAYYRGKEQFDKAAFYEIVTGVLSTIAAIVAFLLTKSLLVIFVASTIVGILAFEIVYSRLSRKVKIVPVDSHVVSYGRHVTFMTAINFVAPYADRFAITYISGFEGLAVYSIANSIPSTLSFCGKLLSTLLLPKLSRDHPGHVHRIRGLFWWFSLVSLIMVVLAILIMPWLIQFLFSDKYVEAVKYSQVAMLYLVFFIPTSILYAVFQGRKSVRLLYAYNLGIGITDFVLLAVMVPLYGVWGAIVSNVILGVLGFIFLVVAFYRKH